VSELAYVTTHFDSPSSPHFVADRLSLREVRFYAENGRFAVFSPLPFVELRDNVYD